jgi:hypothetical protein
MICSRAPGERELRCKTLAVTAIHDAFQCFMEIFIETHAYRTIIRNEQSQSSVELLTESANFSNTDVQLRACDKLLFFLRRCS